MKPRHQLRRQPLVERNRRSLGGGVVDHIGGGGISRQRGNGGHHAVVAFDHVRQELARQPVVREGVDLELDTGVCLRAAEDGLAAADASVVDKDSGLA